jgi:hypothetical protein
MVSTTCVSHLCNMHGATTSDGYAALMATDAKAHRATTWNVIETEHKTATPVGSFV